MKQSDKKDETGDLFPKDLAIARYEEELHTIHVEILNKSFWKQVIAMSIILSCCGIIFVSGMMVYTGSNISTGIKMGIIVVLVLNIFLASATFILFVIEIPLLYKRRRIKKQLKNLKELV
jgi:hypothetical protein